MKNRWIILIAGVAIQTTLGGLYAWSTFTPWLADSYGINTAQAGFIFGMTIAVFTIVTIFAGRLLAVKGPRLTAAIGALLFICGYALASFSKGFYPLLLLGIGGIAGAGIGFGYVCPLSVGMKWFPKKKGLVTGVSVAGFGAGAILLSSVAEFFLLGGMDVLIFFRWQGAVSGLVLISGALLLADPPGTKKSGTGFTFEHSMLFTAPFGIMLLGMFAGTFAGLLTVGNLIPLMIESGLSHESAVVAISIFAVGNTLGRIAWGHIFDYVNYKSIPLSLTSFALALMLLLLPLPALFLYLIVGLLGFSFGANFVIYASSISHYFGSTLFPRLYPICFLAYGLAGIIGPGAGGYLFDQTGSFLMAILLSFIIIAGAGLLSFIKLPIFEENRLTFSNKIIENR
jgi:MFS transporter, OFA family, oxalate/formate antiporter